MKPEPEKSAPSPNFLHDATYDYRNIGYAGKERGVGEAGKIGKYAASGNPMPDEHKCTYVKDPNEE